MTDAREATPADILSFWRDAGRDRWYRRDDAFDAEVRAAIWTCGGRRRRASCRPGKRPMTARWRSPSCSTSFPATCFAATPATYSTDALARDVAAPRHRPRRRRAHRAGAARIPVHAVHAFGAFARPVALRRAVPQDRQCRKSRLCRAARRHHPPVRALSASQPHPGTRRPRPRSRPSSTPEDFPADDRTVNARHHCRFRGTQYCARRPPGLRHIRSLREN